MKDISRDQYHYFLPITTRWSDNDIYGHINNVTYYSYFDTVANHYLIHEGGLDIHNSEIVGYVVHSECHYKSALAYPDELEAGFKVVRLGNSSVVYAIAIFRKGSDDPAAYGSFTHVFVNVKTQKPVQIPQQLRQALIKAE